MAARQPECGICMNSIKNPKVISCHHSFCYTCLEDYLRVNIRNGRFDCPICRTNVELPSECVPGFEANVYVNTDYAEKESHGMSHCAGGRSISPVKHCSPLLKEDIELHHAREPWKPKCLAARRDHGEVDIRNDDLYKKVRGILNKLTPQTFQKLVAEILSLKIDTETCLRNVIDIVYETAICDPRFSTAYANMCRCLSMFKVPAESKQGDVNFRALLLTRCQREFEKTISSEKEFDLKREEIDKSAMEKEKQQMIEKLDYEEKKVKRRSSGNIRFIGELFKLKMLTENIMHDCVYKLLLTKDEDNIECLCILLKTIGKELDSDRAKRRMDQYFAEMQKIFDNKKLSSKVRFMLLDVIELRQSYGISHSARGMGGQGRTISPVKHISPLMKEDIELHHAKEPWKPKCLAARIDHGEVDIRSDELCLVKEDIELHHAKEPWKPKCLAARIDYGKVDISSDELYKKVRGILNKLTPQTFQKLVAEMQSLKIDTETCLKNVIDIVFETAICDPRFSAACANMCRCLAMFKVPAESKQGDVNFRALLLTRCQHEFANTNSSEKELDSKRKKSKKIEKSAMCLRQTLGVKFLIIVALLEYLLHCLDLFFKEKEKQQMIEKLDYEEKKVKKRSSGNIRFIGELFKIKMLTENIMHDCVFKLLRSKDEENLECLCILLQTIGKELDSDKAKRRMDQYFVQMQTMVNKKKLSSKVRFMLLDVIELRQVKWVPRRDDNKTIDQIHQEEAQKEQDRAMCVQTLLQAKPQKGSHGSSARQPSGSMDDEADGADGSNIVSRASLGTDQSIDPTKLNNLGLRDRPARLHWFKGSTGGGARSQEEERPNSPGNRFSVLNKTDRYETNGSHRGGRWRRFGRSLPPVNLSSQKSEREKAITAAKTVVAQRLSEAVSGGTESECIKTMEKPSTPIQEVIDDQIGSKARAIMDDYLQVQDVGEAISCVQELSSSGSLHLFVYNALNQVLKRSEVARRQTGQLLHDLVKNNVLLVDTYVKGLNQIMMYAEDMEIDIPQIWEYLGQLIGPMVQDGSVPLGFLKQVCEPLTASSKSGILIAEILHDASNREGHQKVARLWAESGLHWSDFVPEKQIDQFLAEKKLEFTKVGNSAPKSLTASMAIPKIEERLNDLITNKGCSNEEVFDWIEEEVDELTIKQEYFIRALMTAVCKSAVIDGSDNLMKVDISQIQKRNNLLQKYLDHQVNFELQALYALQALVHKLEHPPGVLQKLFDILYDEDIISEDTFIQWEKSEDPREQEGKSLALKQVVQFFKWLKEAEDDVEI